MITKLPALTETAREFPGIAHPDSKRSLVFAGSVARFAALTLFSQILLWPGSFLLAASVTGGFVVDTSSREEVRSFYKAVYSASEGVPIDSTADVTNCIPGTNSTAFSEAVLRRVNWFRAMAGIPASVTFDATNSGKAQQAGLMMAANGAVNAAPPPSWTCYTANGAQAAGKCNLALGFNGSGAIRAYMDVTGTAANRRWVLYPQTQIMATGDIPPQSPHLSANALWILDANFGGPRPATRTPYVSWPPPGYVPYQVAFVGWSFAYPGANFSNAVVVMRSNNVAIPSVNLETVHNGSGENTLVWEPANFFTGQPSADIVYSVSVSNVLISGGSSNFSYNVTVFDPATLGADSHPPTISGPSQPAVGQNNSYTFTAVPKVTGYEWRQKYQAPFNLVDGAENGSGNFAVSAATNLYALIVTDIVASGTHAYHLAMPNFQDQILTLTNSLYAASNSVLTFQSRLTFATTNQVAKVQASQDEGDTWTDLYSQPGTGGSGEASFASHTVPLDTFAGESVRLRFNYDYNGGIVFNQTNSGFGWYLDDITLTNIEQLVAPVIAATAGTNFMFNPALAGHYQLNIRGLIYGDFPLDWGPTKLVTAISTGTAVRLAQPVINNSQLVLDFNLISGSPGLFTLEYLDGLPGVWSLDAAAVLTTNVPASSYRFTTVTNGAAMRFYRVHVQ